MEIIKDEYSHFNEFNKTTEYKQFPAEVYLKPKEENSIGAEQPDLGREVTTHQEKPSPKRTKEKTSGLLDKIFNSLKGCAAITTVSAVAIMGAAAIDKNPTVELVNLLVDSTYIEYELSVEELNEQKEYAIVVSTTNEDDVEFPVEDDGIYANKVEGLKPEWEYILSFVCIDEYLGETVIFKKVFQTKPQAPPGNIPVTPDYKVSVTDITIEGLNEVDIYFTCEGLDENCSVELLITYGDDTQQVVELDQKAIDDGRVSVAVNGNATLSVTPIVRIGGSEEIIELSAYGHTFTETLKAEALVGTVNDALYFYVKALTNGATHYEIVNETEGTSYVDMLYENESTISYYYDDTATGYLTYTLYLTTEDGQRLSNGYSVTFNAEFTSDVEYVFNYKNPSDIGITYNDDGTINVYVQTDFESANPDAYCQITLGNMYFRSKEPVSSAIGIPDGNYGITYDVCIEVDGVSYSVYNVTPSGTVNEYWFESFIGYSVSENTLTLSAYDHLIDCVDLTSVRLVTSTQEEIIISESDWVYDSESYAYICTVELAGDVEYVDAYAVISPTKNIMEHFDEYVGSNEKEFTIRIER